jgi:hypothetical protein
MSALPTSSFDDYFTDFRAETVCAGVRACQLIGTAIQLCKCDNVWYAPATESVMELLTKATPIPGGRIAGYRNSLPRRILLLGLGERGTRIACEVATHRLPNVEVVTNARPVGWDDIAKERTGESTNMVVIVCGEGDEHLFSPSQGRPDMPVTFVVLKEIDQGSVTQVSATDDLRVAQMRGLSDLFVTTSDSDYVADLIENLAS